MGGAPNLSTLPKLKAGRSAVSGTPKGPSRTGGTDGAVPTAADTAAVTGARADGSGAAVMLGAIEPAARLVDNVDPPAGGNTGVKLGATRTVGAATTAAMDVIPLVGADADGRFIGARLTGMAAAADTAALAGADTDGRSAAAGPVTAGLVPLGTGLTGRAAAAAAAEEVLFACTGSGAGCAAARSAEAAGAQMLLTGGRVTAATPDSLPGAEAAAGGALLVAKPDSSAQRLAWPTRTGVAPPETAAEGAEVWGCATLAGAAAEVAAGSDTAGWLALARTKPGSTGRPELVAEG